MSTGSPWHEDDSFWRAMHPLFFGPKQWADAPLEAEQALALLGITRGAAVLDLGCGPGRHLLEFAGRGYRVTGVDRTGLYLEEAQRRADARGLAAELVLDDMRRFVRPRAFDGAVSLSTSFGYFEDPEDDRRVLLNLCRSLKEGGRLVIQMLRKEAVARGLRPRECFRLENGATIEEERSLSRDGTWFKKRRCIVPPPDAADGRVQEEFSVSHRLYSATDLSGLLERCGFSSVEVFGDLARAPCDERARELVAVASR